MNTPGMARLRAMRLAKDAMDRDWADPRLDLDAVAAHAGYSRYHFVRAFKAAYGESPGQYLARRRIERAEELLRTADLSVTEVCMAVGFTSLGSFSARFKRQTGTSPSDYRRRHGRRAAAMIPGCYAMLFTGGFKDDRTGPPSAANGSPAPGPAANGPAANSSTATASAVTGSPAPGPTVDGSAAPGGRATRICAVQGPSPAPEGPAAAGPADGSAQPRRSPGGSGRGR